MTLYLSEFERVMMTSAFIFFFYWFWKQILLCRQIQYELMGRALDLIHKGCFYEVAAGCHSLLTSHKFLGSLGMNSKQVKNTIITYKTHFLHSI